MILLSYNLQSIREQLLYALVSLDVQGHNEIMKCFLY